MMYLGGVPLPRPSRPRVLLAGDRPLAFEMADELEMTYEFVQVIEPRIGMTLLKMRETAQNSLFYLGEVLMTEAKVDLDGCIGFGLVTGEEKELAQKLAIIDAAYIKGASELNKGGARLGDAEERLEQRKIEEQCQLEETKVRFDTMGGV